MVEKDLFKICNIHILSPGIKNEEKHIHIQLSIYTFLLQYHTKNS